MKSLGHISMIEFGETYGSVTIDKVALFNSNVLTEEDAIRMIKLAEYNSDILVMDKKQWINIFCNGNDE